MDLVDTGLPRDLFDPYTVRVTLSALDVGADPRSLVAGLLADVADRCEKAGASLIGHIKCHVVGGGDSFHCNLTSRRVGARCGSAGPPPESAATTRQPPDLRVDLAVLVYGLTRGQIEVAVRDAFAAASKGSQTWSIRGTLG